MVPQYYNAIIYCIVPYYHDHNISKEKLQSSIMNKEQKIYLIKALVSLAEYRTCCYNYGQCPVKRLLPLIFTKRYLQ